MKKLRGCRSCVDVLLVRVLRVSRARPGWRVCPWGEDAKLLGAGLSLVTRCARAPVLVVEERAYAGKRLYPLG